MVLVRWINMFSLEQKCLNHYKSIVRDSGVYIILDHDDVVLSLILNGLGSCPVDDDNPHLRLNELLYYVVISFMSAS